MTTPTPAGLQPGLYPEQRPDRRPLVVAAVTAVVALALALVLSLSLSVGLGRHQLVERRPGTTLDPLERARQRRQALRRIEGEGVARPAGVEPIGQFLKLGAEEAPVVEHLLQRVRGEQPIAVSILGAER